MQYKSFTTVARYALAALVCAVCLTVAARAQVVTQEDNSAPPRKYVTDQDRAKLAAERDFKDRVKLSLLLAEGRLQLAVSHTEVARYIEAGNELGIYQALVEDLIVYVQGNAGGKGRMRDTFKRVEIALRSHVPRLETLRRTTPSEDAVHVRACIEFVRDARTRALESFYDDSVLRTPHEPKPKELKDGSAKNDTQAAPEKKPD